MNTNFSPVYISKSSCSQAPSYAKLTNAVWSTSTRHELISLITPFIIETLYGEEYKESAYYASIVILSLGLYLVNHLLDNAYILHHTKNIVPIYVSKVGVAIIQLALILLLFLFGSSSKEILKYLPYVYVSKILIQILLINLSNYKIQRNNLI